MTSSRMKIRRWWPSAFVAAACAMAVALGSGATAFGSAAPKPVENGASPRAVSSSYVVLTNVGSGKNLDIDGPSTQDGAVLHIWHSYSGAVSQQWVLKPFQNVNGHVAY